MKYFVELWNIKPAWIELSKPEKETYMQKVAEVSQDFSKKGINVLTWSKNTTNDKHKANYDFFAIWTVPTDELANTFLETIQKAGWYNYFDQVNLLGSKGEGASMIQELIQINNN